jgi:hypothetical protein
MDASKLLLAAALLCAAAASVEGARVLKGE